MDLEILNIASDTDNNKNIENYTHSSKLKNSLCGDEVQITLIIEKDKIIEFGYQENSCVYCKASASLISKVSLNNQKKKVYELCNNAKSFFDSNFKSIDKEWILLKKIFKKKNLSRKECILLPFNALKKIVSD